MYVCANSSVYQLSFSCTDSVNTHTVDILEMNRHTDRRTFLSGGKWFPLALVSGRKRCCLRWPASRESTIRCNGTWEPLVHTTEHIQSAKDYIRIHIHIHTCIYIHGMLMLTNPIGTSILPLC